MGTSRSIQYAFQYWAGGVSALYVGADAAFFVDQHYSPDNGTYAAIVYGNNPAIADAYDRVSDGTGLIYGDGGDVYSVDGGSFAAFI